MHGLDVFHLVVFFLFKQIFASARAVLVNASKKKCRNRIFPVRLPQAEKDKNL